jgi:hypothetical protein
LFGKRADAFASHHMVMDPRDRRTILMTSHTGHLGPTIFQSTDLGKTWKEAAKPPAFPKAPEGQKGLSVHHNFWLSPGHTSEPRVWYVGTSPAGLFAEDDGMTWEGSSALIVIQVDQRSAPKPAAA